MEIRPSRYNLPFMERPVEGVYWLSLDAQRDIRLGLFDSHVYLFRSIPKTTVFEVYNPLTEESHLFHLDNDSYQAPFARNPVQIISVDDQNFLNDLFLDSGIKAAGRRLNRCT